MARAKTQSDIEKLALARVSQLSADRINNQDDFTGRVIGSHYDLARERALLECPWSFALKPVELDRQKSDIDGFSFMHILPSDHIRPAFLGNFRYPYLDEDSRIIKKKLYIVESYYTALYASDTSADTKTNYVYVENFTDVSSMPAHFIDLFVSMLALRIARPIVGRESYRDIQEEISMHRAEALFINERESPAVKIFRSVQHQARDGFGYGSGYGSSILRDY